MQRPQDRLHPSLEGSSMFHTAVCPVCHAGTGLEVFAPTPHGCREMEPPCCPLLPPLCPPNHTSSSPPPPLNKPPALDDLTNRHNSQRRSPEERREDKRRGGEGGALLFFPLAYCLSVPFFSSPPPLVSFSPLQNFEIICVSWVFYTL